MAPIGFKTEKIAPSKTKKVLKKISMPFFLQKYIQNFKYDCFEMLFYLKQIFSSFVENKI